MLGWIGWRCVGDVRGGGSIEEEEAEKEGRQRLVGIRKNVPPGLL